MAPTTAPTAATEKVTSGSFGWYSKAIMGMSPGAYVLKRKGHVAYVGRSDSDVEARESQSFSQGDYDLTSTIYPTSSARGAYLLECRLFHKHDPIDNEIHPRVPAGTDWRCPVPGCRWS